MGRRHEDTNIEEGLSTAVARVALCTVALFRKGVFVVYFYLQYNCLFFLQKILALHGRDQTSSTSKFIGRSFFKTKLEPNLKCFSLSVLNI